MSEEKVLTLRGKKAVWAPVPAGVGGGFVANIELEISTEGAYSFVSADKTGNEIAAAITAGTPVYVLGHAVMSNVSGFDLYMPFNTYLTVQSGMKAVVCSYFSNGTEILVQLAPDGASAVVTQATYTKA